MLDGDMRKMLIAQIGSEFSAHSLYMGISVYFDQQSQFEAMAARALSNGDHRSHQFLQ